MKRWEKLKYNNDINKWDRQPEEPKASFKYFSFYLVEQVKNAKDPLQKTADYFERKLKYMFNMSSLYEWQKRAEAYNQYLAEQNRKKLEKEYEKVCNDTMIQIVAISQITGQKINSIITKVKNANGNEELINEALGNISLPQLSQVLKLNQDIMKTILRIPDSQEVAVSGNVATTVKQVEEDMTEKLSKLSPEKREEYLALQAELNDEGTD